MKNYPGEHCYGCAAAAKVIINKNHNHPAIQANNS